VTKESYVRVRIAPSPTGPFHWGTARTALFNWLFARHHGGSFVVRIDDTDKERSQKKFEEQILEGLKWLKLDWNEGPGDHNPYGPYRQSERGDIYHRYLEQLIKERKAYYCYCTKEDLDIARQAMLADGLAPKYSGTCRLKKFSPSQKPQVIRFATPSVKVTFKDYIRGGISFDASSFGDFAIAKNLDSPLFNFAGVIDDELMHISHVIRGEDHISNTPRHILLIKALGFSEPIYAHLPLIFGSNKEKLSKRQLVSSIDDYAKRGYIPQAIVNFLALLGWHPPDDREVLSLEELVKDFDLKRVQKSGAIFNDDKLLWLNSEHIKALSVSELTELLMPYYINITWKKDDRRLKCAIALEQSRISTLNSFMNEAQFYFELPEYDARLLIWRESNIEETREILSKILMAEIVKRK